MIRLSRLYIYPVKSMKDFRLSKAYAENSGLVFDRYFMVTNAQGKFITARQYPPILLFKPIILDNGIQLQAHPIIKQRLFYIKILLIILYRLKYGEIILLH